MTERIEFDFAGFNPRPRYTHIPSGDTCLRQPYMDDDQWAEKKAAFLERYPGVAVIGYRSKKPVDTDRDSVID